MTEFWESSFRDKQAMWGYEPADAARTALSLFQQAGAKELLIPGFGYGRNAHVFTQNGFRVTGIEISETAIAIAQRQFGESVQVYHGSVTNMPFDEKQYDGIFCYALIHLLDANDRAKLVEACFRQLKPEGYMVFVALSKSMTGYGEGERLSEGRYLSKHGVKLYYYDAAAVEEEFSSFGLLEATEIEEPARNTGQKPSQKFWQIICKK